MTCITHRLHIAGSLRTKIILFKGFSRNLLIPMAHFKLNFLVPILLMTMLPAGEAARTPPGIAKNPSQATCKDIRYKQCYNLVYVCPKFCPDQCTVHCPSCKPVCSVMFLSLIGTSTNKAGPAATKTCTYAVTNTNMYNKKF